MACNVLGAVLPVCSLTAALIALAPAAAPPALTLEDVVHAAVANNVELLQKRLVAERASAQEGAAWLDFTPSLTVGAGMDSAVPVVGPDGSTKLLSGTNSSVGVSWKSPVGTRVGAGIGLTRVDVGPAAASAGQLSLTLDQPLLKNAWLGGAGAALDEAALQARIARAGLRQEVESFIVDVETAYWDLALAQADVQIKERSLQQAQQQYDDTAENIRRGILADVEIYLVDENRVFFESQLAQAVEARAQAKRALAQLMWLEPSADVSVTEDLAQVPVMAHDVTAHDAVGSPLVGDPSALDVAMSGNPGLAQTRLLAELAHNHERSAAVAGLPSLDLQASVTANANGSLEHSAAEKLLTSSTPTGSVGLAFSVPLAPPPVQAGVTAARLEAQRARLDVDSAELHLRHDIDSALASLALGVKLEKLGREELALADKKLQAQEDKYKNGISTLADVVRFQRELDDASIALRQRVRAVHVARAHVLELQGRLAESAGVEVR